MQSKPTSILRASFCIPFLFTKKNQPILLVQFFKGEKIQKKMKNIFDSW